MAAPGLRRAAPIPATSRPRSRATRVAHRARSGELPAEERAVERHRCLGVGLEDVDPAGHSGLVVVALAHPASPYRYIRASDWKNQVTRTTNQLQGRLVPWRRRSARYGDRCGVARALDIVGERWALLVVRELLLGPKRFTDLRAGLPHVGPDILAQRLRELEASGIVRRGTLPPPAGSRIYELTERGRQLEPVVLALGRFGSVAPFPRERRRSASTPWSSPSRRSSPRTPPPG